MSHIRTKDGHQLYVKDQGIGRPVVMLHGWPLTSDTFDDLSLAITNAGMRAISYDRRGFGRSDQPHEGYDYDTLADDLAAVMDACQVSDATLIGFSMGGGEVARYLTRHGSTHVKQAVLISSVVPYMLKTEDNPSGVEQRVFDEMEKGMKEDRAKFWSGFFTDFYGVSSADHSVSEEVLQWTRSMAMQAGLKATLACANAFASTDFRPDLKAFTVPTLIIHGTADKIVPIDTSGRKTAAAIAESKLLEYDGAPHGLFATHKSVLTSDVLAFLRQEEKDPDKSNRVMASNGV